MKSLKRLYVATTLALAIAVSAFAGEIPSPPCAPDAGSTSLPPCSVAQIVGDDSATQNQAASTASGTTSDYSINDATVDVLLAALSLF